MSASRHHLHLLVFTEWPRQTEIRVLKSLALLSSLWNGIPLTFTALWRVATVHLDIFKDGWRSGDLTGAWWHCERWKVVRPAASAILRGDSWTTVAAKSCPWATLYSFPVEGGGLGDVEESAAVILSGEQRWTRWDMDHGWEGVEMCWITCWAAYGWQRLTSLAQKWRQRLQLWILRETLKVVVLVLFKQIVRGQGDGFRDLHRLSGSITRMK